MITFTGWLSQGFGNNNDTKAFRTSERLREESRRGRERDEMVKTCYSWGRHAYVDAVRWAECMSNTNEGPIYSACCSAKDSCSEALKNILSLRMEAYATWHARPVMFRSSKSAALILLRRQTSTYLLIFFLHKHTHMQTHTLWCRLAYYTVHLQSPLNKGSAAWLNRIVWISGFALWWWR